MIAEREGISKLALAQDIGNFSCKVLGLGRNSPETSAKAHVLGGLGLVIWKAQRLKQES